MSVSLRSTLMHVLHVRPEKMIRNASPGTNFILRRMVDSRVPHRLDHLDATDIDFFVPETTGVLEGSEIKISECDEILERMGNIDFAVVDRQRAD